MGHPRIIIRPTPMIRKQMGQMAKLFGLWPNSRLKDAVKKRAIPEPVMRDGAPDFLSQTRGLRTKYVTRRQLVLNRHFTEIVSDVLAINFSKELQKTDIKITSIETKAWNKGVRIFYSRTGQYDETTHKELMKLEAPLRYAISERRLIGRVPQVNFVYDASCRVDELLNKALDDISIGEVKETNVMKTSESQLYVKKDIGSQEAKLVSKKFVAPPDMDNTLFGLNYPDLYDEVATQLSRGRGESARIAATHTSIAFSKPLFREVKPDQTEEEDPVKRLLSMKKFMINQKLKAEHKARVRRKEELLSQNAFKWVQAEENDQDDEKIAPDIPDPTDDQIIK